MGIQIFSNVRQALSAGYMIESVRPDSEGFLHTRRPVGPERSCA
jgi:hypothetical protein